METFRIDFDRILQAEMRRPGIAASVKCGDGHRAIAVDRKEVALLEVQLPNRTRVDRELGAVRPWTESRKVPAKHFLLRVREALQHLLIQHCPPGTE